MKKKLFFIGIIFAVFFSEAISQATVIPGDNFDYKNIWSIFNARNITVQNITIDQNLTLKNVTGCSNSLQTNSNGVVTCGSPPNTNLMSWLRTPQGLFIPNSTGVVINLTSPVTGTDFQIGFPNLTTYPAACVPAGDNAPQTFITALGDIPTCMAPTFFSSWVATATHIIPNNTNLIVNASGGLTVQAGINSSGVFNHSGRFNQSGGDVYLGGQTLKIDNTNQRVGIGTQRPLSPLHVDAGSGFVNFTTTGTKYFSLNENGVEQVYIGSVIGIPALFQPLSTGTVGIALADLSHYILIDGTADTITLATTGTTLLNNVQVSSGYFQIFNGTIGAPSLRWTASPTTGFSLEGNNQVMRYSINGIAEYEFNSSELNLTNNNFTTTGVWTNTTNCLKLGHTHNGTGCDGSPIPHLRTTPGRALDTLYTNTKTRPIMVYGSVEIITDALGSAGYINLTTNTTVNSFITHMFSGTKATTASATTWKFPFTMVVQPREDYAVRKVTAGTTTITLDFWNEVDL